MGKNSRRKSEKTDILVKENPCKDCPFRRKSPEGWLGPYEIPDLLEFVALDVEFPCHMTMETQQEVICSGYVHYRNNCSKICRMANRLKKAEDQLRGKPNDCFSSVGEFVEHHDISGIYHEYYGPEDSDDSGSSEKKENQEHRISRKLYSRSSNHEKLEEMKTLVIENQYDVDPEILGLIKDNPDTFGDVREIVGAQNRNPQQIFDEISECEALIIKSTFMNKSQLEDISAVLTTMKEKHIFVYRLESQLEEWFGEDHLPNYYFNDYESFKANIQSCFKAHKIYSFDEEDDKSIRDKIWEQIQFNYPTGRGEFTYREVEKI